jgi:hypothetical protein
VSASLLKVAYRGHNGRTLEFSLATAINNQAAENDVKDAVFKMHDDVAAYLGQQAQ